MSCIEDKKIQRGAFKDYYSITIQGWMINKLNLHGNKLLVYAAVYTYSMFPDSEFTGSEDTLSALCDVSTNSIRIILDELVIDRLILMNELEFRGKKHRTYKVNNRKLAGMLVKKQ